MRTESPARPVRHVVWDWNGTILDDNHAVVASVNTVCAAYGHADIDLDHWRAIYRRPIQDAYRDLLGRPVTAEDWVDIDRRYHEAYRELLPTCRLAPGIPDELHHWGRSGGRQSLLSMWFHHELVPLVTELGLADVFTRVDGLRTEVGGGGGSKAEHLVAHLAAQGLDPADVVVVGDVLDDAVAASAVGARCVLVTTGVMAHDQLVAGGVPVVDSVGDALRVVGGFGSPVEGPGGRSSNRIS